MRRRDERVRRDAVGPTRACAPLAGPVRIAGVDPWASHAARRSLFLLTWAGQALRGDRLDEYLTLQDKPMPPLLAAGEARGRAQQRGLRQLAVSCRALVVEPTARFNETPEQALDQAHVLRLRSRLLELVRGRGTCVITATGDERLSSLAQTTLWIG